MRRLRERVGCLRVAALSQRPAPSWPRWPGLRPVPQHYGELAARRETLAECGRQQQLRIFTAYRRQDLVGLATTIARAGVPATGLLLEAPRSVCDTQRPALQGRAHSWRLSAGPPPPLVPECHVRSAPGLM